jgi:hypothetical protein
LQTSVISLKDFDIKATTKTRRLLTIANFVFFISFPPPPLISDRTTLGGRGDSFYEYLLKYYLQTGQKEQHLLHAYYDFMDQLRLILLDLSNGPSFGRLMFVGELPFDMSVTTEKAQEISTQRTPSLFYTRWKNR